MICNHIRNGAGGEGSSLLAISTKVIRDFSQSYPANDVIMCSHWRRLYNIFIHNHPSVPLLDMFWCLEIKT
jgi:hypothetical protein